MAELGVRPLSDTLGLPDIFPHDAECAEDQLTPEVLLHGYRHSEAAAVGLTPQRELALTLTDQPAAFYSAASLAYWRRSLRQQLQGPARLLACKRKAHESYDVPLGSNSLAAGPASGTAVAATLGLQLPPPAFPQQSSRGPAGREAAEAWARQQLAAPGAPPLCSLGWGGGSEAGQVPHGFPRNRAFELLAELEVPLPRALWFLRVLALNRTRPAGWDGASEAQQSSRQFTEELLAFLESVSTVLPPMPTSAAAQPVRRPPLPSTAAGSKQGVEQPAPQPQGSTVGPARQGSMGSIARFSAEPGSMPAPWHYGMRLAGHCCAAGLLDAAKAAEWAANNRLLLPLPAAARQQVLNLLSQCLQAAPLAQQQVLALAEQLFKSAEAVCAAAEAAVTQGAGKPAAQRQQAQLQDLQLGLLRAAAGLLELRPTAFVAADEQLLSPVQQHPASSAASSAQQVAGGVADARRRLARALHARVLTWHDAKAMQLLDEQLLGGSSATQAAVALLKLVTSPSDAAGGQANGEAGSAAAASATSSPEALADAVRLVCDWAAAAPAADFGAAIIATASQANPQQQPGQQARDEAAAGAAALLPERVLFALVLLPALAPQPAQPEQKRQGSCGPLPLQLALSAWLSGCAVERGQPAWRRHRLLYLAVLLAEAGLFCPAAYLQGCLATAAFDPACSRGSSTGSFSCSTPGDGSSGSSCSLHLALLEQLHPLLDFPSLQCPSRHHSGGVPNSSSSSQAWSLARQQYARCRAAVLAWHSAPAGSQAASSSSSLAGCVAADDAPGSAAVEMEWEQLCAAPGTPRSCGSSEDSGGGTAAVSAQPAARWQDPTLLQLQNQLMAALGFTPWPATGAAQAAAAPQFGALLEQVRHLRAWQQRLLAHALLSEAKAFLASTDSGGGRASRSPSPPQGTPRALAPDWFLQMLAVLRACCAHREILSLLATALNLLQRAVAAAVRTATAGHQGESLGNALTTAQQQWQQRSGVSPPLLLSLLAAYASSLVAAEVAPKLLPMLTGGLWRLQQAAQQQTAERCLAGQRQLAADLLSLPGGPGMQQWLDKMQQEHGSTHWVVATLMQARLAASRAAGGCGGGQQLVQQQGTARLQVWLQRAQQLFPPALAVADGPNGTGEQQHSLERLLQLAGTAGSNSAATASGLAAVQHSLEPAALPGLVHQLGGLEQQQQELVQHLLQVGAPAAAALLADPQHVYSCVHSRPNPAAGSGTSPWQLALGLFAAAAGPGAGSVSSLLQLSGHDAMVAAAAAITPATARCGWLLLRLLLDERQWQGGHKLAEAERRLAACAAQQAILRPESAAALAATLCSLSPSAAAGQQLLAEVEALLRPPVVDLAQQAVQSASRQPSFGTAAAAAALQHEAHRHGTAPPPLPFGAEQGLVDAALICLSTGSSGERQHTFAQQLIRQLLALGDALLPQQAQQTHSSTDVVWGPPSGHGHTAAAAAAAAAASPAAVQVSVWLRLALLLPLLPLVYKHRTADASGSLRGQLLRALLRLLAVPAVRADAAQAAAEEAATAGATTDGLAAAAAAAAQAAGEPLPQRLLHLLRALLVGGWASWMRLEGGKLRDVPPFEHSRQLAADAAALPLPCSLQAAVQEAMPLNKQQALAYVPASVSGGAPSTRGTNDSAGSSLLGLDPWLLLEGGTDGGNGDGLAAGTAAAGQQAAVKAVPPWMAGAIKRRRRNLRYWPTPPASEGPLLSITEQLQAQESRVQ